MADEPQVAQPPPSEGAKEKPQWWATMSDDITSTAKTAQKAAEEKVAEAKERFESVKEEVAEAVEGAEGKVKAKAGGVKEKVGEAKEKAEKEAEEKHSLLGDLWKGAKSWFGSGRP